MPIGFIGISKLSSDEKKIGPIFLAHVSHNLSPFFFAFFLHNLLLYDLITFLVYSVHLPPPPSTGGLSLRPDFQKGGGGLTGSQFLEGSD